MVVQKLDGGIAQPALGHVDDPLEGEIVSRLVDKPQIGQSVANFHALVETRAPNDAIVEAERDETVFEFAHLERRAHQDRDLVERMTFALHLFDVVANAARLFFRIPGTGDLDFFARLLIGAQVLPSRPSLWAMRYEAADRMCPVDR